MSPEGKLTWNGSGMGVGSGAGSTWNVLTAGWLHPASWQAWASTTHLL